MGKHYQESEIEFRRTPTDTSDYPETRGIIVLQYGGTLEECIEKARKEFKLGDEWEAVTAETSEL